MEYTLPDVSQTVILTRMEGRTPMPEKEKLRDLASHNATMIIFLSVGFMDEMVKELTEGGYRLDTPVAVVYKASWPEQKIVRGTLKDIARKVKDAEIDRTALTLVGDFLGDEYSLSKLYDKSFTTGFRCGIE
jgi:precorrin-4/cobalt-precorrin-4 C11-methyltransferase